jgi:hypothetical protein
MTYIESYVCGINICTNIYVFRFVFKIILLILPAGWQGDVLFKVTFSKGGAIEFAEAFQRAVRNGKNTSLIQAPL